MAAKKLMGFLCQIVQDHDLEEYLEEEDGVPVMYTFGKEIAKACVLRCTTEQKAKEIIKYLRGKGDILFGPPGQQKKIRVISGFDDRSDEHKMADFMMRKMRLALHNHQIPEASFFTEWSTWKMYFLQDGNMENRKEVARWCPATWTYTFSASIIEKTPWWKSIKEEWMYLIRQDPNKSREEFEQGDFQEDEARRRRPGTDGHRSSSGGEEDDRAFNPFARWV